MARAVFPFWISLIGFMLSEMFLSWMSLRLVSSSMQRAHLQIRRSSFGLIDLVS